MCNYLGYTFSILLIWQLWNELELHISEQADEEVIVEVLANRWENIAKCFVDDHLDKGRQPLILNYHQKLHQFKVATV